MGAVTGEVAATYIREYLYGKKVAGLTEAEKRNISSLSQLASGLAVASVGGNTGDISAAIASSKNAVENNFAIAIPLYWGAEAVGACYATGPCWGYTVLAAVTVGDFVLSFFNEDKLPNDKDPLLELAFIEGVAIAANPGYPPNGGDDNNDKDNNKDNNRQENQKQTQQERIDELKDIYDKNNSKTDLKIDGQTIRQGTGGDRYVTRIYESQNLTDQQIKNYVEELAGQPLTKVKDGIFTARLQDGTNITLRNISSSADKTGARWTLDIRNNPTLARLYWAW